MKQIFSIDLVLDGTSDQTHWEQIVDAHKRILAEHPEYLLLHAKLNYYKDSNGAGFLRLSYSDPNLFDWWPRILLLFAVFIAILVLWSGLH